jgi:hypothetical protein
MSNETKTAVEWYDNQLRKVFSNTTEASNFSHEELLQQAKEMEKEQIMKACDAGFDTANLFIEDMKYNSAEDYYEQTYGGKK